MIKRVLIFLLLNFLALALGGLSTNAEVMGEWYRSLHKAPWTPPGWVFGAAWTTIMVCFSFYLAYLWERGGDKKFLVRLYIFQWALNISWNPIFFTLHQAFLGLIVIIMLTMLIGYFLYRFHPKQKSKSIFILPYFLWLIIATSLNLYICMYN